LTPCEGPSETSNGPHDADASWTTITGFLRSNDVPIAALDTILNTVIHPPPHLDKLEQSVLEEILHDLHPAERVPSSVIFKVISSLGSGTWKPSASTQAALLRWLMSVHEVLEEPNVLDRVYSVLFNLLDMISIRTDLCHLLCLITRRKHVKQFRARQLLDLNLSPGPDPSLTALLKTFQHYMPDLVPEKATEGKTVRFIDPDGNQWNRLRRLQNDLHRPVLGSSRPLSGDDHFQVMHEADSKRLKLSPVPVTFTSKPDRHREAVTVDDIDSIPDLAENLENVLAPDDPLVALQDPIAHQLLVMESPSMSWPTLDEEMSRLLAAQAQALENGERMTQSLSTFLRLAAQMVHHTKVSHLHMWYVHGLWV